MTRYNPGLPSGLETVVATAMRRAPGERYVSAAELLADLEKVASGSGVPRSTSKRY